MIVTSTYQVDSHTQADGRSYVTEIHTDSQGKEYRFGYLATPDTEYATRLAQSAANLETQLAEQEFNEIVYGS